MVLQVVVGRDQFLLQVGEQFGIRRRIVGPDVVGLLDDAAAEQPGPDAVDDVAREPGILGRDQPVGEDLARVAAGGELGGRAIGEGGGSGRGAGGRA